MTEGLELAEASERSGDSFVERITLAATRFVLAVSIASELLLFF